MPVQNPSPIDKPVVFILCLDKQQQWEGLFDAIYGDFTQLLLTRYRVQLARMLGAAHRYLANPYNKPVAILMTDPSVTLVKNKPVLDQVKDYVHGGGTAVFMGNFSSFITMPAIDDFWKDEWQLGWKHGDYHRTDVHFNTGSPLPKVSATSSYSQKALFLKNVAREDSLYLPSAESRIQSAVFAPEPVDQTQAAVAFAKVGEGWLGYVGDVNNESGSQKAIMDMCQFASKNSGAVQKWQEFRAKSGLNNPISGPTGTNAQAVDENPLGDGLDLKGHQADYFFTHSQLDWIEKHFENSENFMLSYGLKPWNNDDIKEAKAIADAMVADDNSNSTSCETCKKTENLKRCAKCKTTSYCSRECQKTDWKSHKKICSKNAATARLR